LQIYLKDQGTQTKVDHLADCGFTVEEGLAIHGAKLEIPAFTCGKQLSQKEVETLQQLSAVLSM